MTADIKLKMWPDGTWNGLWTRGNSGDPAIAHKVVSEWKKKKKSRIVCVSDGLAAHFSKWKPTQGGGQWQQQTQQQQKCRVVRGRPIFYPPADEKWPSIRWQDARARALVSRFSRCPLTNGSVVAFNSIPIDVNSLTFSTNLFPKNLADFAIIFQTKFDNFFKKINLHTSSMFAWSTSFVN